MTTDHTDNNEPALKPCPFCGGPAEKRLIDGPKRGFIGCFTCMIGLPFNMPYGDKEVAAWNSRTKVAAPPMCPVHTVLDQKNDLEFEIGNNCVACSLNERTELLKVLEPYIPEGEIRDAVEFLKSRLAVAVRVDDRVDGAAPTVDAPIDMILFCPRCGAQHVDAPEDETSFRHRMEAFGLVAEPQDSFPSRWTNPPHKSHLCHQCGAVWRPADVATNGVAQIRTQEERDTWTNSTATPATTATTAPVEQSDGFPVSHSMPKDYDAFRQGMLRAAEMARNEFKRAPEAAKGHDCVYMGGYEDACDHLSAVIAQAAVIDSVRLPGAQPDWQYHISLLLPEGIEDDVLLKVFQVVEHELRHAATGHFPAAAAPVCEYCDDDDEGELTEARKKATQYFRWAYQLLLALAKRRLADANAENEASGEPDTWPAGQQWHEMAGSSHSIFLRGARDEAKIPEDAFMAVIRSLEMDVDDLYAAALRTPVEGESK